MVGTVEGNCEVTFQPRPTTCIEPLLCLFLLAPFTLAQMHHTSAAETDRFLLCARSTFQRPVYMTVLGPWFDAAMKCSSDREEIVRELQEREITVFENDSAVLLLPPRLRPDIGITDRSGHQVKWNGFEVKVDVSDFGDALPMGSRRFSKDEQNQIAKVILEQALTPPLVPALADVNDDTAEMTVDLLLDAHHLTPETESVVAVFGTRLVYGELTHGVYRMLWDTPLFGSIPNVTYKDVDGDGVLEIVATWSEAGGSASYSALAVFNTKGEELTRQEECYPRPHAEAAQFACGIWGADVELEKTSAGKYDILDVPNNEASPQDAERYTLVSGHYSLPIPVLTAIRPTRVSRKMVNGKLTLIGRNFIRDSEVRFVETSGEFSDEAHPPEVVVTPEFVSPTELKARVSDILQSFSASDWQVRVQNASGHSESLALHVEAAR